MPIWPTILDAAATEARELTWLSPIPAWVWILAIVPAVAAFALFVYRRERSGVGADSAAGAKQRGPLLWVLAAIRILVILTVVALLAEPVLRTIQYQNIDASIIVLVDDSLSMDIADKYSNRELVQKIGDFLRSTPETIESTKRYDLVRRLLRDADVNLLEKLRGKGKVAIYSFAGGLRSQKDFPRKKAGDPDLTDADRECLPEYEGIRAEERVRETRISDALLDAVASERSKDRTRGDGGGDGRIAGVILLSDGQQTPGARAVEEVARRLGQQRIPVFTVGIGNPDEPKDIRVLSLDVSEVVLAGDLVPFDAAIASDGFQDERARVDLKIDGEVVATQYITLEGGGKRQPVRLEHKPPKPGDFTATVEVEHKPGELFVENNAASKPIKVLDQKIRVLLADGPPRWGYRYLNWALTRDPTMLTQVFLFSADPNFVQDHSQGAPPLTEFPRTREAFSYHVIILGDVDAAKLGPERMTLLKEFVYEAGGGLVFIAGDNANPWGYLHTDLYSLLPVEVPERNGIVVGSQVPKTNAFNVELTQAGKEHTVLRLDNDLERNLKLWENKDGQFLEHLPGFLSFQEVGKAKKGAVVLARHPTKVHPIEQKGLVVFAFMNYGKGRTFFSAVDDTWRWRLGVGDLYFYRFWGQVIRFCATGRLLGKTPRYAITTDKSSYTLGDTVDVTCHVYDANMKPATEKSLTIYHYAQSGDAKTPEAIELELDPIQGQGTYHGALVASRLGLNDVWIGTETERFAFRTFDVAVPALELRDPRRNRALLEEVALLSGGSYVELQDIGTVATKLEEKPRALQGDVADDPIWDDLWLLLTFTCLISAEWILRKVVNLL